MSNVTTRRAARTALTLQQADGTAATVRRIDGPLAWGRTPRFRMYRLHIHPVGKAAAEVTVSRVLLKQLINGGARITSRVA
jgi:hypothetical protein